MKTGKRREEKEEEEEEMRLGCLSGEATWLVEWRVNLSEIERR